MNIQPFPLQLSQFNAAGREPDVDFVVGRCGELEAAAFAGVRFLLSMMHPAVSDQLALLGETFVTVAAGERLLTWRQTG